MWIETETMISISQANKDLTGVLKIVDQYGSAVVMKNNMPAYVVVEAAAFAKEDLDKMSSMPIRDASRNFSDLTYKIYDNGYVLITRRNIPICVFYSYGYLNKCNNVNSQYIKKEDL